MAMDLTGINNYNEYYTNHYFSSIFEENAAEAISAWRAAAKESEEARTPWSLLRECGKLYNTIHERYLRSRSELQVLPMIKDLADTYLEALGFPQTKPDTILAGAEIKVPVYLEVKKANGAPSLWVLLAHSKDNESGLLQGYVFDGGVFNNNMPQLPAVTDFTNEELITKILFGMDESPRWVVVIGIDSIALIDRNKWGEKRYLEFDLEEIFSRREETTLQAMAVLLHRESLCPDDGNSLLDKLDENSHRHSSGVSQDLKYALRETIELLGNEVLYDMEHRQGRNMIVNPVDASELTIECLRYMYRMLFVLFIEARPELGYAPMKAQAYVQGYSLESLRDIADSVREDVDEVGEGYYLHETLSKLYDLIYNGYPITEAELLETAGKESLHDVFVIEPLKAHIFDPEYTKMITNSKLRNSVMLKIIDLMSISRGNGKRGSRGRISYSTLGINQMGAVYEALLSYRGFISEETLFEVKRAQDDFNELEVGYFVPERELGNYTEEERVRYQTGEKKGKLRKYEKGTFIYRLAGREREKSASYYTPEVLTRCLVKYALKELLEGKTADEILNLTICEPAMGSAAFLNEAVNQLAEEYINRKQHETGNLISYENRYQEIQRVKMYIADHNVYGIDLNPIAVELAEVSLWLNTIYKGGFVPWFGTQLVNGNSLIGARRQVYRVEQLETNHSPDRWWENAPIRITPRDMRMPKKQIYHFLMGDPGMANYTDKVIKDFAADELKLIKEWNKKFTAPYNQSDIDTLLRISGVIDTLWDKQVELRKEVGKQTADALTVFGHEEDMNSSHTSIREKDLIFESLYKTVGGDNASPYARLKFAMDYWCALWFWPIDKADLLPTRSEFLFDMDMILEGGIVSVNLGSHNDKKQVIGQVAMFPTEMEEIASEIYNTYSELGRVCLDEICEKNPRLEIARRIANRQKFFHWEMEFADLFAEHGGFDLIVGNPPWIKSSWKIQDIIGDFSPIIYIRNYSTPKIISLLNNFLAKEVISTTLQEYVSTVSSISFYSAIQNYILLTSVQTNLYKCFITQGWGFVSITGVCAYLHPEGVYEDMSGLELRYEIYKRLCFHFRFENQKKLFPDIEHNVVFGISIYGSVKTPKFLSISNLYLPNTIDQCFQNDGSKLIEGIKTAGGEWNINGHPDRIVEIEKPELSTFAALFSPESGSWKSARLPAIHGKQEMHALSKFKEISTTLASLNDQCYYTEMWDETSRQKDGTIISSVKFPKSSQELVFKGPQIGVANPVYQCPRNQCVLKSDYDRVDLTFITEDWLPRTLFVPNCNEITLKKRIPSAHDGQIYTSTYRVVARRRLSLPSERTLICAIIPPGWMHADVIFGMSFSDNQKTALISALLSSLPYDFLVRTLGKSDFRYDTASILPITGEKVYDELAVRVLLLNCVTSHFSELWNSAWRKNFPKLTWTKKDLRLKDFSSLSSIWSYDTPLRNEYARRQALVEIDVLVAMELGWSLNDLLIVYRNQFPVLSDYEQQTFYDINGRIVFRPRYPCGVDRATWESNKNLCDNQALLNRYIDDTMPGGPTERTIEYVAPFDRCDREQDYETAWKFFEKKYGKQ